jgi:hypothetical protein
MTFDWRMDRASWLMIFFIIATMLYYVISGAGGSLSGAGYLQAFIIAILSAFVLIAIACIPVLIACYFIKKIPDIDYAVWVATGATIIGIISELLT